MRFVCETCNTRYIIPDERARGRVLKVRCKKCGNVIVLRPDEGAKGSGEASKPAGATAPVTAAMDETRVVAQADLDRLRKKASTHGRAKSDRQESAAQEEQAEWHVIVSGQQIGPLPLSALIEKMAAGQMSSRSYIWRDPMPAWLRASQVSDVARWLPTSKTPVPAMRSEARSSRSGAKRTSKPEAKPSRDEEAEGGDWEALGIAATPEVDNDPAVESFFREAEKRNSNPERATGNTEVVSIPARGKTDPFAEVPDAPGIAKSEPSENTKFFITQAQIAHSPWRIAAFVGSLAFLLIAGIFLLSRLGVRLPLLPHRPPTEEERVFSGEAESNDPNLRDRLIGRRRTAEARANDPRPTSTRGLGPPAPFIDQGPLAHKDAQKVEKLQETDKQKLRQLYQSQQLETLNVKAPAQGAGTPAIDRPDAPLTPQQVGATVSRFQSGYNMCIDRELKRNPAFRGGKIRIVTTIMSSGLVKQAQLVADDPRLQKSLVASPLAGCLTEQTRRMVFPNFQGEAFDAEIPLVLGSSF
jgi:predicted Zn finger-like uncharacterized protein